LLKKAFLPLLAVFAACPLFPVSVSAAASGLHTHRNDIPPRLQWEAYGGYCGEVSFISAGLYYGQYMSQYEARICAIGNVPQNQGELLLGRNAPRAARRMHLQFVSWKAGHQAPPSQFLLWIKRHVLRGWPVIIGVYDNGYKLGTPHIHDNQYDHIVTVVGVHSQHAFSNHRFFGNDHLTFTDNGLVGTGLKRRYFFTYSFAGFPKSRKQVEGPTGPLYGLPDYGHNFGIAITGVADKDGDTLPVRLKASVNYELPKITSRSTARPTPMPLTLTITVSGLTPGVDYKLYRYDRLTAIPDRRFNANAASAAQSWSIRIASGSTFAFTQEILSDEIAAYRCVRADAK
jgi:hypothetical protein